ncbi:unnamed protein product [Rangifer tarandus platyrhynchus]|uniref:Uncharacterized protein n=1 Tax=Rangifer tarandus platyrhynchus TaxID=3082113 RepID=A0AC59Y9D8_RANTA
MEQRPSSALQHPRSVAAAHKPPRRRGAAPTSGPTPRPPRSEERAPPSPRSPGHGPALPPPGPNRTAGGAARALPARPAGARLGSRPAQPPPSHRPVPASRLTGSRLDRVRRPYPAPVPSSSRSNRLTPPARPRDDLTRTPPLRADVKARHRPPAPFIERDEAAR